VDSDGAVRKLIPIWREAVVNGIMPFEVKAGNNVEELTAQWPDMVFIGGIDKHEIAKGKASIDKELGRRLPSVSGCAQKASAIFLSINTFPQTIVRNFGP